MAPVPLVEGMVPVKGEQLTEIEVPTGCLEGEAGIGEVIDVKKRKMDGKVVAPADLKLKVANKNEEVLMQRGINEWSQHELLELLKVILGEIGSRSEMVGAANFVHTVEKAENVVFTAHGTCPECIRQFEGV